MYTPEMEVGILITQCLEGWIHDWKVVGSSPGKSSLIDGFDNPLMLWIMSKENGSFSFFLLFCSHATLHCSQAKWAGGGRSQSLQPNNADINKSF